MTARKNEDSQVEELVLAIGLLVRRIRADAPQELRDFSWTQKAVLSRLERDGPATTADLARAEGVKPQSMGTALASLEEMGLIERHAHPTDGRQMYIQLTARGVALRRSIKEAKHAWLSQALAKLNKEEQTTLFKAGELIKRMAEMS
ncbi:MAG TPA: MarR family transcriptional regulator [Candidatus Sulfotelmatobacter sp.]|nr:MarR family transcriptional regulator [Candidatus Sulfotelmatobacter sp.]